MVKDLVLEGERDGSQQQHPSDTLLPWNEPSAALQHLPRFQSGTALFLALPVGSSSIASLLGRQQDTNHTNVLLLLPSLQEALYVRSPHAALAHSTDGGLRLRWCISFKSRACR